MVTEYESEINDNYAQGETIAVYIQDTANELWFCTDMMQNMWDYGVEKGEDFDSDGLLILQGFFTNLLANVISIDNIFRSLIEHSDDANYTGVVYDSARLFRVIVDFEPVETQALDPDYVKSVIEETDINQF
jgi:hypothetical protein